GVLDAVDQAQFRRLRLGCGCRWFRFRLRDDDTLASPFQELLARPAERVAVLVVVPALFADDHPVVTSTASVTSARLTISTLCVTWAGLAAITSASSLARLIVAGSSTVTRTRTAKFGDPGRAPPAVVELATPPVSCSSDRKSTRLNSSHGSISYAVFCLKKKKKTHASEAITQQRSSCD